MVQPKRQQLRFPGVSTALISAILCGITCLFLAPVASATPVPELKLDENCEPAGWLTRLWVSRMDSEESHKFWNEQRMAVEKSFNDWMRFQQRIITIQEDSAVDFAIAKRRCLRDRVINNQPYIRCELPEADAMMANADREITQHVSQSIAKKQAWAIRCLKKAERLGG